VEANKRAGSRISITAKNKKKKTHAKWSKCGSISKIHVGVYLLLLPVASAWNGNALDLLLILLCSGARVISVKNAPNKSKKF